MRNVILVAAFLLFNSTAQAANTNPLLQPTFKKEQVKQDTAKQKNKFYTNSQGNKVKSPVKASEVPAGATAKCYDGTYSFSQSRGGTCSHHGGVELWLN